MPNQSFPSKKIFYLTFARFPSKAAHAVNIIKMSQSIKKMGFDLTLVADFRQKIENIFDFYSIRHTFNMHCIKLPNIRVLGRAIFLIKAFFFIKKKKPDIIFVRDIFNAFLVKSLKVPFIFEVHEIPSSLLRKIIMKKIITSKALEGLIFISEGLKNLIAEAWPSLCLNKKYIIAHDGVDLESFNLKFDQADVREILNLDKEAFIAGYAGSLFPGRGAEIILKLAETLKNILFVVIGGEGKYMASFKDRVKSLRLQNLIYPGFVPHKMVPLYLHASDVLLMPYQQKVLHRQKKHDTSLYMSPLKMFEYMASGKPIIASRIDVITEILQNKKNAILVTPDDVYEWVKALTAIKKNKSMAIKISRQAKQDVIKYDWDERASTIFSRIIEQHEV